MNCPKCNAPIKGKEKFCGTCGAAISRSSTCKLCGATLENDSKFCLKCGAKVESSDVKISAPKPEKKPINHKKRAAIIITLVLLLIFAAAGCAVWYFYLSPTTSISAVRINEQLELGQQYLIDEEYDKAIIVFEEIIESNPKLYKGYVGLADAYIGKGDKDKAMQILQTGYEITKSDKIKEVQIRLGVMVDGGEVTVTLEQVDTTSYPTIRLYYRVLNAETGVPVYGLTKEDFTISENVDGAWIEKEISNVSFLETSGGISATVIADASGSMDGSRMNDAKTVMKNFADSLNYENGDQMEILAFDSNVYEVHKFSNDRASIKNSIDWIMPNSQTALYDALYAGTSRAAAQGSAKCVIAFTDGGDNVSSTSPGEVINNANRYSIPVFIIGVGVDGYSGFSDNYLTQIANETGGFYKPISDITELSEIYESIYVEQKQVYMLEYETSEEFERFAQREVKVDINSSTNAFGKSQDTVSPQSVTSGESNVMVYTLDNENSSNQIATQRYGNTPGNIVNCGYMAQQGDWVYYRNGADNNTLYKKHLDGSGQMRLSDHSAYSIGVLDDYVYYSNENENDAIYKVKIDGTERQLVTSDSAFYLNVVDDWIYYRNSSDGNYLYRINTDGSNRQCLNTHESWNINVIGDDIYYQARLGPTKNDWYLYKMSTNGGNATNLTSDNCGVVICVGDWVYYRNFSDEGKLYRVDKNGNLKKKLNDDLTFFTNVTNNYIYYGNSSDNSTLYRVRTDGTEREKIADMPVNFINFAGELLMFENPGDSKIYVTDEDGSYIGLIG